VEAILGGDGDPDEDEGREPTGDSGRCSQVGPVSARRTQWMPRKTKEAAKYANGRSDVACQKRRKNTDAPRSPA
jgi:hypothetical protein